MDNDLSVKEKKAKRLYVSFYQVYHRRLKMKKGVTVLGLIVVLVIAISVFGSVTTVKSTNDAATIEPPSPTLPEGDALNKSVNTTPIHTITKSAIEGTSVTQELFERIRFGDEFYDTEGDVSTEKSTYLDGVFLSHGSFSGGTAYYKTYEHDIPLSIPWFHIYIKYTDNSWGDGPEIHLWHWADEEWHTSGVLGKGEDVYNGVEGIIASSYLKDGEIRWRVVAEVSDGTDLAYTEFITPPSGDIKLDPDYWSDTIQAGYSKSKWIDVCAKDGDIANIKISKDSGPDWITVPTTDLYDIIWDGCKGFDVIASPPTSCEGNFDYQIKVYGEAENSPQYVTGTITVAPSTYPPEVTTIAASTIDTVSATLNGYLDDTGGETCYVWFEYGETTPYEFSTAPQPQSSTGSFDKQISGFESDTVYHFRAVANNSKGTDYGDDVTFRTKKVTDLPEVRTIAPSNVGPITATLNGYLEDTGGETCEVWFEYGETTSYGSSTSHQSKSSTGSFSKGISDLEDDTTYHFRAVAENSQGTDYGEDETFETGEPYNPKISLPACSPHWIDSYIGNTFTYVVKVQNAGRVQDTIDLTVTPNHDVGYMDYLLSETSITLAPNESKYVNLSVTPIKKTPEGDGYNQINVNAISRGNNSKFSSCSVVYETPSYLDPLSFKIDFLNPDAHNLSFSASENVKIFKYPYSDRILCVYDLNTSQTSSRVFYLYITDQTVGETLKIPLKINPSFSIFTTDFDISENAYSFQNWNGRLERGLCYGMAETSVLFADSSLILPNNVNNTSSISREFNPEIVELIKQHQYRWENNWVSYSIRIGLADEEWEYNHVKAWIGHGKILLAGLSTSPNSLKNGHAVVITKIVECGDHGYLYLYDPNWEYNDGNPTSAYRVAFFNKSTMAFLYGDYVKFVAGFAKTLPSDITTVTLECPLNVTFVDQYGRIISDDGTNEIPNANITITNDTMVFYLPANLNYTTELVAYDSGTFNLSKVSPIGQDISVTKFENIFITASTKASVAIEPNVTSYTMDIDYDGDGNIEENRDPDLNEIIDINIPPNASFNFLPEDPRALASITFNASNSFDPDGTISTYEWDFGDDQNGEGVEVAHSYSLPGNYTVFLRATDEKGASGIGIMQITVLNPRMELKIEPVGKDQLRVNFNTTLPDDFIVDLRVMDYRGVVFGSNPANHSQSFSDIMVANLQNMLIDVDAGDWEIGEYTFYVKTDSGFAPGLDARSNSDVFEIRKPEIDIDASKDDPAVEETIILTVRGSPYYNIRIESSEPLETVFVGGIGDYYGPDTEGPIVDIMNKDGTNHYAVHFTRKGTYEIEVEDLDEWIDADIDITVSQPEKLTLTIEDINKIRVNFDTYLLDEDMTDLKIIDPEGATLAFNPTNTSQVFCNMTVQAVKGMLIDTNSWDSGRYTAWIETNKSYLPFLDVHSNPVVFEIDGDRIRLIPTVFFFDCEPPYQGEDGGVLTIGDDLLLYGTATGNSTIDIAINDVIIRTDIPISEEGYFVDVLKSPGTNFLRNPGFKEIEAFIDTDFAFFENVSDLENNGSTSIFLKSDEHVLQLGGGPVIIGDDLTIHGSATDGHNVDIVIEGEIVAIDISIKEIGDFEVTLPTPGTPHTDAEGVKEIKAFIDTPFSVGENVSDAESSKESSIWVVEGIDDGEIAVYAEKNEIAVLKTVRIAVVGSPGHNITVDSSDPLHTDFIPGMCDNPYPIPVPFTDIIDEDSIRTYGVRFNEAGTYTITVTDIDTGNSDSVDISVEPAEVVFDMADTCTISDYLAIKGYANTGDKVDIAIDDEVWINDEDIGEDGSFREWFWFDTEYFAAGSIRIAAYIDRYDGHGPIDPSEEDDGNTTVILMDPALSTFLSKSTVSKGDAFRTWGYGPGARDVDIITISPNGGNGNGLDGDAPLTGITHMVLPISKITDGFTTRIDVDENADMGSYKVIAAVPGKNGIYEGLGDWWRAGELLDGIIEVYCEGDEEVLAAMTQEEIVEMIKDATINAPGSDDLLEELDLFVGTAKLTALFTYTPQNPFVNQTIVFDASSSYDPAGNITNYKWDFGDGNITNTTEKIITQSYAIEKDYTVNLTVTNEMGLNDSTSKVVSVTLPKENWTKTYGGSGEDRAYSVQQTTDGGYIFAGYTEINWDNDFWLVKTDSSGNEQWEKTFDGPGWDEARAVQQTADGGYILAGFTDLDWVENNDFWLIKTDSGGNELWNRTFGGPDQDETRDVQQTADGGYILAGFTESYGAGSADFWLVKTDSNGTESWNRTFGGSNRDDAYAVQQTADGGYILAGYTASYGTGGDFWLVKTDSNGTELWKKTFGGSSWDGARAVQQTSDGGYILAGTTESYGAGDGIFGW